MTHPDNHLAIPIPGSRRHVASQISQCVISFGSNLGDRRELIATAASRIDASGIVLQGERLRTSRLFETPPIGGPGEQEPFLNAVGAFQTTAPASEVLAFLQQLETELGRQRRLRWDARSIDLDVVLHGQLVGGATGLVVPHPRYTARQFVLRPACDVAPEFQDPRFGWTLKSLAEHISAGVPSLALVSGSEAVRRELCDRLAKEFSIETFTEKISETNQPWVADHLPEMPSSPNLSPAQELTVPRLLVRIQQAAGVSRWPAPHQMWPSGWRWPEYRLEIDDMQWAVAELASALASMRCEVTPVTDDGDWFEG